VGEYRVGISQENDPYIGSFKTFHNYYPISNSWPCPAGYRPPSLSEWKNLVKYNTFTKIGNWSSTTANNADAGVKIGENLFLPSAGAIFGGTNGWGRANYTRGSSGTHTIYWTADYVYGSSDGIAFYINSNFVKFEEAHEPIYYTLIPVRCMKE